jgi:predicted membrane protein
VKIDKMKKIFFFIVLYVLMPLIIIPALCIKFNNWYGLFAIGFYYIGLILAKYKQSIFLPIPIAFCLWYWYTYGFSPFDYVFAFFFSLVSGYTIFKVYTEYNKFVNKTLPEKIQNDDYDEKLKEMYSRIEMYKNEHPNNKVTQDIIDKIKTEVFF